MRGRSGAVLTLTSRRTVRKTAAPDDYARRRLGEQARYIHDVRSRALPRILNEGVGWYEIPLYDALPFEPSPIEIVAQLDRDFWSLDRPELLVTPGWATHFAYMRNRLVQGGAPHLIVPLRELWETVDWPRIREPVVTHGDPTRSNIVWSDGALVFLDPLPPSLALPSLKAVDTGKLLQSTLGYERVLAGWPPPSGFNPTGWLSECLTQAEVAATWYWCAAHMARVLIHYEKEEERDWLIQQTTTICRVRLGRGAAQLTHTSA